MGKQDKNNRDFKGKMTENKYISYRTLLSTLMNEVKAIRGSKTHSGKVSFNLLDIDIPSINLAVNIPEYQSYVEQMIQSYNKYLGYSSNITFNDIKDVFDYSLELYATMWMIFRYYQSNEMKSPTGEEVNGIFDKCVAPIFTGGATDYVVSSRIDNSLKGISNKVWESDYISRVEQILLPPQVLEFYNYYLSQLFNVSDNSSKEKLTFARIWVSLEKQEFITIPNSEAKFPKLTATKFKNIYDQLIAKLTPKVRDFICGFLGWAKPNHDWTRPITADVVYVNDDEKFKSTFNSLFPEKVDVQIHFDPDNEELYDWASVDNGWTRYYYDFEILLQSSSDDEYVAEKYYFGIDNVNLEQYLLMQNEQLNDIKVDFYNYLLLTVLAAEEISGSKAKYVGGIYSMLTSVDCMNGSVGSNDHNQIYIGNDLKMVLYDQEWNTIDEQTDPCYATDMQCIIGDALEVAEYSENLAVFNYPINVPEVWDVLWKVDDGHTPVNLVASVAVNAYIKTPFAPDTNNYTDTFGYKLNHDNDYVAFDTYVMDPNEVHLALQTVIFSFLTGFASYNESIQFIDTMFRNKQQETS